MKSNASLDELLGPDEPVVYATRQHLFAVTVAVLKAIIGLLIIAFMIWGTRQADWLDNRWGHWVRIILDALGVFAVLRGVWNLVAWNIERLVVSTEKVVHVSGVLNRRIRSTPLVKIEAFDVRQSLLGRMFHYGRLEVDSAAEQSGPLYGLRFVPHPAEVYRVITDHSSARRAYEGGAISTVPPPLTPTEPPLPTEPLSPPSASPPQVSD